MKKLFLALALALFAVSVTASAGTVTYTNSVVLTTDSDENDDNVANLLLSQFDDNGGEYILDSVTITLTHYSYVDLMADNDSLTDMYIKPRVMRNWTITGTGVDGNYSKTVIGEQYTAEQDNGDLDLYFDYSTPDGVYVDNFGYDEEFAGEFTITPANLNSYIGTGDMSYEVIALVMSNDFVGSGDDLYLRLTDLTLTVKASVTYNYHTTSDVPEPAGAALFALAAVGVLFMRKRSV